MNILLWVLQTLLAVAFFAHGVLFLSPPAEMVDKRTPLFLRRSESSLVSPRSWP